MGPPESKFEGTLLHTLLNEPSNNVNKSEGPLMGATIGTLKGTPNTKMGDAKQDHSTVHS